MVFQYIVPSIHSKVNGTKQLTKRPRNPLSDWKKSDETRCRRSVGFSGWDGDSPTSSSVKNVVDKGNSAPGPITWRESKEGGIRRHRLCQRTNYLHYRWHKERVQLSGFSGYSGCSICRPQSQAGLWQWKISPHTSGQVVAERPQECYTDILAAALLSESESYWEAVGTS